MSFNGETLVSGMIKLRDASSIKDVTPLTAAMFPGPHCPLMGAAMAVRGIRDAVMLIVGMDECAYYTKHMTLHSEEFGGLNGRCVSVLLDSNDVTFGCAKKIEDGFAELMNVFNPKVVFIVTTCVVEIIGEDADSIARALSDTYKVDVLAVHTEHFKCENHLPGLVRTMEACFSLMGKTEKTGKVNLLGQRMGRFEATELSRILRKSGVQIGMQLPCGCTVGEICQAGGAALNIVMNDTALPLALRMEAELSVPYVRFDKFTAPDLILRAYTELFSRLNLPTPDEIIPLYEESRKVALEAKQSLSGVTYIYGNTPFMTYEFNRFMADLGMIPLVIQTSSIEEADRGDIACITALSDPYVTKSANIAPLQYVYDVLRPNLYLGHEYAMRLRQKGIALVRSDRAGSMLGFEVTTFIIDALTGAAREASAMRLEGGAA